jgi:ribosomal protein L29
MAKTTAKKATEVKTIGELQVQLETKRADLLAARRGLAAGELANPRVITTSRKEIARILTAIRATQDDAKESK